MLKKSVLLAVIYLVPIFLLALDYQSDQRNHSVNHLDKTIGLSSKFAHNAKMKMNWTIRDEAMLELIRHIKKEINTQMAKTYGLNPQSKEIKKQLVKKLECTYPNINDRKKTVLADLNSIFDSVFKNADALVNQAIHPATHENKKELYLILKSTLSTLGCIRNSIYQDLGWCGCMPWEHRIALIVKALSDITLHVPNHNQPVVYTTFASGCLLQDYFILSGIIELLGYKNVEMNLIDLGYKKKSHLTKWQQKLNSALNVFVEQCTKMAGDNNTDVTCNIYTSAHDYIKQVNDHIASKSTIHIMVDPTLGAVLPNLPNPHEANMIGIQVNGIDKRDKPQFFMFVSDEQPIALYTWIPSAQHPPIKKVFKTISTIVQQTHVDRKYKRNAEFIKNLIAAFKAEKDIKLTWYSEPQLAFQELSLHTTKDDTLIYRLQYEDPIEYTGETIKKCTRKQHIQEDVINLHLGRYLIEKKYKHKNQQSDISVKGPRYGKVDINSGNFIRVRSGFPVPVSLLA